MFLDIVKISDFSSHFNMNKKEDAQEFLQCFLNKLEICCNYLDIEENIVQEAFGGSLVNKVSICIFVLSILSSVFTLVVLVC